MGFHAIVYLHGMGDQQRYGELARLVDALAHRAQKDAQLPQLHPATTHNEPLLDLSGQALGAGKDIGYLQLKQAGPPAKTLRCYEVYWAPITAGKTSALEVLRWMLPQFVNAWNLLRSDWTGQPRMRRLTLHRLWATEGNGTNQKVFDDALKAYEDYVNTASARAQRVSFTAHTRAWLNEHYKDDQQKEHRDNVLKLVDRWQRELFRSGLLDLVTLVLLTVLTLQVIVTLIGLLASSVGLLTAVGVFKDLNAKLIEGLAVAPYVEAVQKLTVGYAFIDTYQFWITHWKDVPGIWLIPLLAFGASWYALWLLQQFLREFLGDVQLWTTYQETDAKNATRDEILERTRSVFAHVLAQKDCEGVTIVAHSLGSTIALDALCRMGREVRAEPTGTASKVIHKLKFFITMGSPIDKVYFFFESRRLKFKEMTRMLEHQRGDVAATPLKGMTWLNFFDQGDPVSGTVFSANPELTVDKHVINVEVSNYAFPKPDSHGGYFLHWGVLGHVYRAAFGEPVALHKPLEKLGSTKTATLFFALMLGLPVLALCTFIPVGVVQVWVSATLITVLGWLLWRSLTAR